VHFVDALISVDLILVLLVGMFDLTNLVLVIEKVAQGLEVLRDLRILWKGTRESSEHGALLDVVDEDLGEVLSMRGIRDVVGR
jgi:hypothetical protein